MSKDEKMMDIEGATNGNAEQGHATENKDEKMMDVEGAATNGDAEQGQAAENKEAKMMDIEGAANGDAEQGQATKNKEAKMMDIEGSANGEAEQGQATENKKEEAKGVVQIDEKENDQVEDKIDYKKEEDGRKEEVKEEKVSKTPTVSTIERPRRERKPVVKLSPETDSVKEFIIETGRGTPLKDIPNVQYKVSKKRPDETIKSLHMIIYGRRGKATQLKSNILQFSGFVWYHDEEKEKLKIKQKLDKCIKDILLEFCELLDIPVVRASKARKDDIVVKLIEFLESPHATTDVLVAEKDQSKKRKRGSTKKTRSTSGSSSSKRSVKSSVSEGESDNQQAEVVDQTIVEQECEDESGGKGKKPSAKKDSAGKSSAKKVSKEDEGENRQGSKNSSGKEDSVDEIEDDKGKKEEVTKKSSSKKDSAAAPESSQPSKKTPAKTSSVHSKANDETDKRSNVSVKKQKTEIVKEKSSSRSKKSTTSKESSGKDKSKVVVDPVPSDEQLKGAISDILKGVDLNIATFSDILKALVARFNLDLTPRKKSIKQLTQIELRKLVNVGDDGKDGNS